MSVTLKVDNHLIFPTNDNNEESQKRVENDVKSNSKSELLYSVEECPPWYESIGLGLQHFLIMVEGTVSVPYLLTPMMCMALTDPSRAYVASTILFVSGLITLLQSTIGVRLPIIQGGTSSLLSPTIAILTMMPCPSEEELSLMTYVEREEEWKLRMTHVQGAICAAGLFQVIVGFTGIIGILMKWISPLVVATTISLIGLSLIKVVAEKASSHWGISFMTVLLMTLFSQYLGDVAIPCVRYREGKFRKKKIFIFKLFPVLLVLVISWLLCYILTVTEVLDKANHARTDLRLNMLEEAPWFRIPYPGQWGAPIVTIAGFLGMVAGIFASIVESLGDYYACARLSGAPPPPTHAINRGIGMEGIGTIMAGLFGTGNGTTSYSSNIGAIAVTRVGSRQVIQYAALIMVSCGVIGKLGAIFIMIPEPIIGGIFLVVFGVITSVGLSSLQYVDLNSSRNLFVLGFSIFVGIAIPNWMQNTENKNIIQTSITVLDQLITILLRTSMFVGGFLAFFLDNTIPGSRKERGLDAWETEIINSKDFDNSNVTTPSCYDLPFGMSYINSWNWTKRIPISPTFTGWQRCVKEEIKSNVSLKENVNSFDGTER